MQQTETLRLQLRDALERESNLKKINQSLMQAISRQPQELGEHQAQIKSLKLKHLMEIGDFKQTLQKKQEEQRRQKEHLKSKIQQLQNEIMQRQSILKIMSLKIHQSQLNIKDYCTKIKQLQEIISSQKTLINNARANMNQHLSLKLDLQESHKQEIEIELSAKYRKIAHEKQLQKENQLNGLRNTIEILNAKIKLLQKQREYLHKLQLNREKSYYR